MNFEIGVDRFVARNVSVGIDVEGSYSDDRSYGATTFSDTWSSHFGAGMRFGVNVPFGPMWSWYPRASLGLESDHTHTVAIYGSPQPLPSSWSSVGPWVYVYAPLLVHPTPHFFAGLGPRLTRDFGIQRGGPYDGSQTTYLSAEFSLGGWWGGSPEAAPAPVARSAAPRFGDKGQIVLTTATGASVAFFGYTHPTASSLSEDLEPAFDVFVIDHVSLGVDAAISHTSGTSFDSSGVQTQTSASSYGLAPRIGYDIRFPQALSLWPQAEIGFGGGTSDQTSAEGSNQHTFTRTWVQASMPLLVHPAAHFFLGAGPYVVHDLSRTDQNGYENAATQVGASLWLGGWW